MTIDSSSHLKLSLEPALEQNLEQTLRGTAQLPTLDPPAFGAQLSVSVIIPVYNGEADLPDLIECLRAQTYPAEKVEYLLVDNGSHDRTSDLLQQLLPSQTDESRWVALLEAEIQSSYAARNRGIRAAQGEILAFTDADCRPEPHWLLQLMQPLIDPAVGMVAGEILALPGDTLLERYADRQATLSQKHTLANGFLPYGQTANLAIRRQAFEQVGLFRPYLTTGGDADICWRIQQQTDWQIRLAETAIIRHRHRSTWAELQSQWRRYGRSNRYLHELHGVNLTPDLTQRDYLYRWGRWLCKEVPIAVRQAPQSGWRDLCDRVMHTPIDLICRRARSAGQRQTRLPEQARQIETWMP